jgi:hypothetical protein
MCRPGPAPTLCDLPGKEVRLLPTFLRDAPSIASASGRLLFVCEGTLFVQPFYELEWRSPAAGTAAEHVGPFRDGTFFTGRALDCACRGSIRRD